MDVKIDTLIADLMTAAQTVTDSLAWDANRTGFTLAGSAELATALAAVQSTWRPGAKPTPPAKIKTSKSRRINHADEFSDDSKIRAAFFKATDPERTCLFYAETCNGDDWRGKFTALAADLVESTAGDTARRKAAYALVDAYKQAQLLAESRQNAEAEFWEFVSWQHPHWIDGRNSLRPCLPRSEGGQPIPMNQSKPEVPEAPADIVPHPSEQLELDRELDTPKGDR